MFDICLFCYLLCHISETSVLSVVITVENEIVGFVCFLDSPPTALQYANLSQGKR